MRFGIACACLLAFVLPVTAYAGSEGSPAIKITVEGPASLLIGTNATDTLAVGNPASQPFGYNLSFRAVLPAGISYVAGSSQLASGTSVAEPDVIANQPAVGETTLIWINVADLSPASHNSLSFKLHHSTTTFAVGSSYSVEAGAYIASDPRVLPKFKANGVPQGPEPTSFTGSATGTQTTTLTALELTQTETTSPEGEILRGVHDHQVVYRLTVKNTSLNPTTIAAVDDWLPAALEFLGCGGPGADNTKEAPTNPGSSEEYPGSGPISVPALGGCVSPSLVETLTTDPDGGGEDPSAVYTHVHWSLGTLGANETRTLEFRAAVPLRENTTKWTGGGVAPSPAEGKQTANLDNNSGSETRDGEAVTTFAEATGKYNGTLAVSSGQHLTRTAKDITTEKSASSPTLNQGQITKWTILLHSSEYRYQTALTVTDTLPNGLCPLSSTNLTSSPECEPTGAAGDRPSSPYATAIEEPDGTWTLAWNQSTDPELKELAQNATETITFSSRTRTHYQFESAPAGPILANDSVTNRVLAEATAHVVCGTDTDCSGAEETPIDHERPLSESVSDTSSAGQTAAGPTIEKAVAASGTGCLTDTYVTTVPVYHPGDLICWRLKASFPQETDTKGLQITDFLPTSSLFDAEFNGKAGEAPTTLDTLPETTFDHSKANETETGGVIAWTLPESGVVQSKGQRFERVYATTATLPKGAVLGDLQGNLMKFANLNTSGESFAKRAEADFQLQFPQLSLEKQIVEVGGNSITPASSATVKGGQEARFELPVTNAGQVDAAHTEVWDELPAGLTCANVASISGKGLCVEGRISWGETGLGEDELLVPALGQSTVGFTVVLPAAIDPGTRLEDHAGVRLYESTTNTGGRFRYVPAENIDPSLDPEANAVAANAAARLETAAARLEKTHTSSVVEAGNSAVQATIGETVTFEVSATIPAGTTLSGVAKLTDPGIPERFTYEAGSVTAVVIGAPAGEFKSEDGSGSPEVIFPENFEAHAIEAVTVTMRFRVHVPNLEAIASPGAIPNIGLLAWVNPFGGQQTVQALDEVPIVEPKLGLTDANNAKGKLVHGGQLVEYTLTLTNAAEASSAFDNTVVDLIPANVTPSNAAGVALADGGSTESGGVWSQSARTITWKLATLTAGAGHPFVFFVTVDENPISASSLTDKAVAKTSSLSGVAPLERTAENAPNATIKERYEANAESSLEVEAATVVKTSNSALATIGHRITYTLTVTLPANVVTFDQTVVDTLPDTLDFDEYVSATCTTGCPPEAVPTVQTYTPTIEGGSTKVAWDFGDLTATAGARTVKLVYIASVRATHRTGGLAVKATNKIKNAAVLYYDQTDKKTFVPGGPIPAAGTFDKSVTPTPVTSEVVEPAVTVTKEVSVNGGPFSAATTPIGDAESVRYRLRVTNAGTAPAFNVAVTDTVPGALREVHETTGEASVTKKWSASPGSPEIRWMLPGPLAVGAGATIELGYEAKLGPVTGLKAGQEVSNAVTIPSYFGVSEAERAEKLKNFAGEAITYREYLGPSTHVALKVALPTISIEKTTGGTGFPPSANAEVGQSFSWRVVVKNTSTVSAKNLEVTDTLPVNWEYQEGSANFTPGGGGVPTTSGSLSTGLHLSWKTAIELAAGQSTTLTYQAKPTLAAKVTPGVGAEHPNVNKASAAVQDTLGNPEDADGPFAAGPSQAQAILIVPSLEVTKVPVKASVPAGEADSYAVHVHNIGAGIAHEVVIADSLPAGMTYVPGSATAAPPTGFAEQAATASSASWTIATIAPGASVDVTVPVGTSSGLAGGSALVNEVAVHSVEQPNPVSASGTVTTRTSADLVAEKRLLGAGPRIPGERMTYVVGVTNNGPSVARAVELSDHLPASVDFVSAEAGCAQSAGTVTCEAGDLLPAQKVSFQIVVSIPSGATASIDNTVLATSPTPDPAGANNEAEAEVTPHPEADLRLVKTALTPEVINGQQVRFSLLATNQGPSDAAAATIVDTLPAGLTYVSAAGASCTAVGQKVTCPLGALASGASATVELTVLSVGVGTRQNAAIVSATTEDPKPLDNSSEATVQVLPAADLALEKTVAPEAVELPGEVTYTIKLSNAGPDAAQGVVLTDPLPSGETYVSDDAGCIAAGQTVTCQLGEIANGATRTIHVQVRVGVTLGEQMVVNTATVTSATGDPVHPNNLAGATVRTGPAADVALTKTGPASAVPDAQIAWTLAVSNHGPSTAHAVTVVDPLPTGASYVSAAPSQGSCAFAAGVLTCELGALASGAGAGITVAANVTAGPGSLQNTATVSAQEPDPEPANNAAAAGTSILPAPVAAPALASAPDPGPRPLTRVTLRKVVRERVASRGGALHYRLTVRDAGRLTAERLVVCDLLPAQVTVLRLGHGHLARGRVCFTLPRLRPGRTHMFAIVLRVDSDATGRIVNRATVAGADVRPAHARASAPLGAAGVDSSRERHVTG